MFSQTRYLSRTHNQIFSSVLTRKTKTSNNLSLYNVYKYIILQHFSISATVNLRTKFMNYRHLWTTDIDLILILGTTNSSSSWKTGWNLIAVVLSLEYRRNIKIRFFQRNVYLVMIFHIYLVSGFPELVDVEKTQAWVKEIIFHVSLFTLNYFFKCECTLLLIFVKDERLKVDL